MRSARYVTRPRSWSQRALRTKLTNRTATSQLQLRHSQTPLHGHRLRTPPTDKLTTILQQICHIAIPEPNISTCQDVGMWQIFVRWWCSLVLFVAGVRSRCPCSGVWLILYHYWVDQKTGTILYLPEYLLENYQRQLHDFLYIPRPVYIKHAY